MSKYSRDLDPELETLVKNISSEVGLKQCGITIEPISMNSKKEMGAVLKANELVELFTGDDSIVCIALNQKLFDRVDKETQEIWIRSLIAQIGYDYDKDKIIITKPELNIPIGMYQKYGDKVVQKTELAILTLEQIAEEEAEMKKTKKKK